MATGWFGPAARLGEKHGLSFYAAAWAAAAVELGVPLVSADRGLVRAGLVKRKPDPDDRRRVLLTLTPRADRVLIALSMTHLAEIRRQAPQLNELLNQLSADL